MDMWNALAGLQSLAGENVSRLVVAALAGLLLGFEPARRGDWAPSLRGAALAVIAALTACYGESVALHAHGSGTAAQGLASLMLGLTGAVLWLALGTLILAWRNPAALAGAAALWSVAAAGLAAGVGMHLVAGVVTLMSLLFVNMLRWIVEGLPRTAAEVEAEAMADPIRPLRPVRAEPRLRGPRRGFLATRSRDIFDA